AAWDFRQRAVCDLESIRTEHRAAAMTLRALANLRHRTLLGEVADLVGPYVAARWTICAGAALAVLAGTAADLLRPWPLKLVFDYLLKDITLWRGGFV